MTLPEIEATFQPELHALAEANKLSYEGTIEKITRRYDGYHFDFRSGIALYNPFSVLNVLSKQVFYDYWFASGTPTFLAEMLRKRITIYGSWTGSRCPRYPFRTIGRTSITRFP